MTIKVRRFEDELSILRGLIELRKRGVPLHRLESELTRMGAVDLDVLYAVLDRIFMRLEADAAPVYASSRFFPTGVFSAAG